ncbi:MAG: hypothetical protein Q7U20_00250 [Caulobacter sp.]|nr:hypothetical protein [Caulobacter sp.]
MAEQSSGSGGSPWLAFVVGGLLVVVAIVAFMMYSGRAPVADKSIDVKIEAPQLPDAPKLPDAPLPKPG